jgi:hypothetical protein
MMHLDHLPNQRPGEKIQLFLRRYWLVPFEIGFYMIIFYGIPIAAAIIFFPYLEHFLQDPVLGPVIILVGSMYVLGVWLFGFTEFIDYYLDVWIVTNERIINIEQKGLFTRVASEMHLTAIQDVTSEVSGILHTFLHYGNVYVQTAGEKTRFLFRDIPNAESVKEQIIALINESKRNQQESLVHTIQQEM